MTNLTTPVKEIRAKLQSLLEKGHVDEYFVEDIYTLLYPPKDTDSK